MRKEILVAKFLIVGILLSLLFLPCEVKSVQDDYPNKPVQMIVPWSPGPADLNTRFLSPLLGEYFKQPFVVVNKPGAGGVIGNTFLAKSKPDGYTIGAVSSLFGVYLFTIKDVEFNLDSFVPICAFVKTPMFLLVKPEAPWKTFKDFAEDAKRNPGKLRYSSIGIASAANLVAVDLFKKAGIKVTHIPYAGTGDALAAVIGGHVDISPSWATFGHLKSGTLRALAVAERERLEDYPDIPTLVELGYPVVAFPIYGHSAPKGTPKNIVDKLAKGYEKILKENRKAFSDTMRKYDQIAVIMDSDEYGKRMREDYEYLRKTFIEIEKNR